MNPQEAAERIHNVRFTSVNFRRGYDTRDVDEFLTEFLTELVGRGH